MQRSEKLLDYILSAFRSSDIPALKEELEHIQRFIELQLMDANENLLKKAKFERNEEKKSPGN